MTETYVCRLCLKESDFKFSLFTGNILTKIESLTSIKIKRNDTLPKTCCETCVANVYNSYKFQQCIIESDKKLRQTLVGNEFQIIEQAKQAPDVFEILHLDDPLEDVKVDVVESVEPKLEIIEEIDFKCDLSDYHYKIETVDLPFERNEVTFISKSKVVKDILKSTSENDTNLDDLCNGNTLTTIDTNDMDVTEKQETISEDERKDLENVYEVDTLYNELDIKDFYKKELEERNQNTNDNDPDDILTHLDLGIESKFLENFAKYQKKKGKQVPLECEDCEMKFESKRMLQRHMIKHKIDKCPFCSITMRSDNLKRHIQIHTDSPEICEICGKIAKNKESLRGHVNYQHKNTEMIKCETCNREFKSNHHYQSHVRKIHLGIRNHQCHICGKKFFANHDLNKHINMTHKGARPYICQYCKKGFSSPYARKTHIRQHTLETPFRCEICAAGFRQKVSLITHLRSKHSITYKSSSDSDCNKQI